ncbi:uncharacterized protein LOC135379003 isoform X1 [Ornithodoros turicata]|uniref:uncharacterized protein LOC135379003 isoform X1 n=1 Tax=Ornithodoros turicata TaxID=34597 RepID=UPI0031390CC0
MVHFPMDMCHIKKKTKNVQWSILVLCARVLVCVLTAAMLAPLLAFVILNPDFLISAAMTALLPDHLIHTSNHSEAVNETSMDQYQGALLTTVQLDIKQGRPYMVLLKEHEDVRWTTVNAHEERIAKRDVVAKYSPLADHRQYVYDEGDVKSSGRTVGKLPRILQRVGMKLKALWRSLGFQKPMVTRILSADSLTAEHRRVKRHKQTSAGDDSHSQAHGLLADGGGPQGAFDAYRGNLTRDGVIPHFLTDAPKQLINVDYGYGRKIRMGNFFVAQRLWLEPLNVSFPMEEGNLYTLLLTDITFMFWQYWLVVNIVTEDVYSGDELILYSGPFPTSGRPHTLVFLLYSQGTRVIDIAQFKTETGYDLATRDPRVFVQEWNLGEPIAINYFLTDAVRDDVRAMLINHSEDKKRKKRREEILKRRKTKEPLLEAKGDTEAELKQPEEANGGHILELWWPLLLMCFIDEYWMYACVFFTHTMVYYGALR